MPAKPKLKYLVVIDGAGEYDSDFSVLEVEAETPEEAVEWAIAPARGYGRRDDGSAYVILAEAAHAFRINDTRRYTAHRTTVEDLRAS